MKKHNYFVRTKDNIYQCIDDFIILKNQELYIKHFQDHIIKIADKIEELCDLFVDTTGLKGIADGWRFDGYDKSKKALWWISTSEITRYIPISEWNDKTAIKGAIWTDKGLIYVAQINDEGEVELL